MLHPQHAAQTTPESLSMQRHTMVPSILRKLSGADAKSGKLHAFTVSSPHCSTCTATPVQQWQPSVLSEGGCASAVLAWRPLCSSVLPR